MLRVLFVGFPALILLLGLPLVLKLVPPNRFYGFRTSTTLASPQAWYEINFAAGLALMAAGAVAAFLAFLLSNGMSGLKPENHYIVGILLTAILAAAFTIPVVIYSDRF